MKEALFALPGIALTVLCWGMYGPVLHRGQHYLDSNRLKPLICVGVSYVVIAIIVPVVILTATGNLKSQWTVPGVAWSLGAGCAGALGALGIILAMTAGGKPTFVMPLVFGCAPVVAVAVSMYFAGLSWQHVSPIFIAGLILVSVGAATVLIFQPKKPAEKPDTHARASAHESADADADADADRELAKAQHAE